jgi:hypothetical protein
VRELWYFTFEFQPAHRRRPGQGSEVRREIIEFDGSAMDRFDQVMMRTARLLGEIERDVYEVRFARID